MSTTQGAAAGRPSDLIERAAAAYVALGALAETIQDEWQFVSDLVEKYLPAIRDLALSPDESGLAAAVAVDEAIAEIGAITDPHKAIDWLSTFPHLVALAVGGDVDGAEAESRVHGDGSASPDGGGRELEPDDDDSPFRILRGRR